MELQSKVGAYGFMAEPFHCDYSHHLFLGHLGNHLLNAAEFHSDDRGYGMSYLNKVHKTWVLSRLVIEMQSMPRAYDRFTVETWVEGAMRYFTDRCFAVVGSDGHPYGYGRSVWALIDTDTRQPTDILSVNNALIEKYIETEKPCPIARSSRVKMSPDAPQVHSLTACYSDVDVNGHVNSVKYIEHVLDLWPLEWYRQYRVGRFEIAYVAESHAGDTLSFYREEVGDNEFCIRTTKSKPDGTESAEVCRCKIKFVKD